MSSNYHEESEEHCHHGVEMGLGVVDGNVDNQVSNMELIRLCKARIDSPPLVVDCRLLKPCPSLVGCMEIIPDSPVECVVGWSDGARMKPVAAMDQCHCRSS
jgi:hypothetical protein